MINKIIQYSITLKALLLVDYVIFKKEYINKIINVLVVTATQILVTVHILPYFGLKSDFGSFMIGAWLASYPLWESYVFIASLISDISGERKITYELLLPIPSWIVFLRMIISFSLQSIASCVLIIPLGKIFLWDQFDLYNVSWGSCIIMFFANSFFMGAFGLLIASIIRHINQLELAWQRCIFPIWFLGGFQFSFSALLVIFPRAAYFELLNPIIYTNEGFRNALLSDSTYIAVWICVFVLCCFTMIFSYVGISKIRKRLDFI